MNNHNTGAYTENNRIYKNPQTQENTNFNNSLCMSPFKTNTIQNSTI